MRESWREMHKDRASAWLFSALPFSSSLTVERGVSMEEYKVQGEPLVLSLFSGALQTSKRRKRQLFL